MNDFADVNGLSSTDQRDRGKRARVRLSLVMEGWIYLIILSFVSICAVLRNVNLLIVFTGVMIGPIFLSWRIGRTMVRHVKAKRILQNRIHVGQVVNVQWQLTNKRSTPAWYVKIEDRITNNNQRLSETIRTAKRGKTLVGASKIVFDYVPGNSSKFMSYRALFTCRGEYEIGPATVSSTFPMGLVCSWFRIARKKTFFVAPRIGQLNPHWENRIASMVFGNQSAKRRRGTEPDEFYAIREWRSGDSRRDIHWRSTAKLGQPMVRQYDQQSNRDLALVLDLYSDDPKHSLHFDSENCERVLSFAATIMSQLGVLIRCLLYTSPSPRDQRGYRMPSSA